MTVIYKHVGGSKEETFESVRKVVVGQVKTEIFFGYRPGRSGAHSLLVENRVIERMEVQP